MPDPSLALVTGASAGIGLELAREHARRSGDLLLTARRGDVLQSIAVDLRREHGVAVDVIATDLGTADGFAAVADAATSAGVGVLMNNAGFGGRGRFVDRALDDDLAMIDLNVKALVGLCHAVGRDMVARGGGRILNVGSTAALMPGPLQATYFATKAFVRSFSFALAEEMRGTGVTVTALSPGYVETGFAERADLEGTGLTKRGGATPESVAKLAYAGMMAGRLEVINERGLRAAARVTSLLPRRALMRTVRRMQEK